MLPQHRAQHEIQPLYQVQSWFDGLFFCGRRKRRIKAGFHSGDGVEVVSRVVRSSAYDLEKIKNPRISKQSHRREGIGVGRIRTFPFSSDSSYDSIVYDLVKTKLSE